jgi:hypothetical protein
MSADFEALLLAYVVDQKTAQSATAEVNDIIQTATGYRFTCVPVNNHDYRDESVHVTTADLLGWMFATLRYQK